MWRRLVLQNNLDKRCRSFHKIPIVDISPFVKEGIHERISESKRKCALDMHKACSEVGFIYLTGHNIDEKILKTVRTMGNKLFQLPDEEKEMLNMSNARGYQKLGENVTGNIRDMHEGFDLYREYNGHCPNYQDSKHILSKNKWPKEKSLPGFRNAMEEYTNAMLKLGDTVMRCGEHTDYGCLTFVNQDEYKNSLQVKSTQGEWISADYMKGAIVMNIGDMLNVWTNGIYQSTPHRVLRPEKGTRISVPFFYEPNFDAIVTPIEQCLKKSPSRIEPVLYGEHLLSKIDTNFRIQQ